MAKSLRIEIAMAGQEEINRQFAQMSKAGQDCFSEIAAEANKVGFQNLDPTFLEAKYKKFNVTGKETANQINEIVKTGQRFQVLAESVELVERALMRAGIAGKALLLVFGPIGATIAIVTTLIGVALVGAVIKAAQSISALERQSIALGVSLQELSKARAGFSKAGIPFDAVSKGLQTLQQNIDKFSLDRVEKAFSDAQKNIAAGWGPGAENIRALQKAAESATPAVRAAGEAALKALGQPIQDNVTPALESMVRWAGSAAKAIPLIAGELQRLGTAGERAKFLSEIFKQIVAEAPNPVAALQSIVAAMEKIPASAERDRAVIDALGTELGTRLVQAMRAGGTAISDLIRNADAIPQATGDAARQIDLDINKIKAGLSAMFENIPIERLTGAMSTFASASAAAFSTGTTAVGQMNSAMDGLIGKINEAIAAMSKLQSAGPAGGATPGAMARGGMMGGRGTGTSDSNLAWLSRGEHIMPARAVRQPGVLQLLEALRHSGGNLRSVLDRMGHFALGGMVSAPAFARAGAVGGMSNVTIQFPGVQPITGLRASSAVVDELRRSAALAQVRSGGRKPSRYT